MKRNIIKKAGIGLATVAIVVAGVAAFSAFESHIINVTARIENALQVSDGPIEFGTVFPQEYITEDISVALSESFRGEDRVDDVRYVIKQKPKVKEPCQPTPPPSPDLLTLGGLIGVASAQEVPCDPSDPHANPQPGDPYATIFPSTHPEGIVAWRYCEENLPLNAPYDLDETDLQAEYWQYCYLPLANYLSKHEITPDGDPDNDQSVDAFHQAYIWDEDGSHLNPDFIATGYLAISDEDLRDRWTIDLKVPCFINQCAQEADNEDNDIDDHIPGFFVPHDFRLPTSTEHAVFGTDLWIEVTEISLSEEPPPPTDETTITVIKDVINLDGGTLGIPNFPLFIDGSPVTSGVPVVVAPGPHTVSETGQTGYDPEIGGACNPDGTISILAGEDLVCTITNDDIPPSITLTKVINNDVSGGPGPITDVAVFSLTIDGVPISSGGTKEVTAGVGHTLDETEDPDYDAVMSGDPKCPASVGGLTAVLDLDESISCTITNTFDGSDDGV